MDEGTLRAMRRVAAQVVEVTFAHAAPQLPALDGVHVTTAGAKALRLAVSGPLGPVIDALAGHEVTALTSREPSLEEIFLHHYDGTAADGRR